MADPNSNGNSELKDLLRQLRADAGITQEQLAKRLNVSTSLIAKFETGRLIPMDDTAAAIDVIYDSGTEVQQASRYARERSRPVWLVEWTEAEEQAVMLRTCHPLLVPGLLQTEAYTRALLAGARVSEAEIEATVAVREQRRAVTLDRDDPPMFTALLSEIVLRTGSASVMKEQIEHLVDLGHRDRCQILVVPLSVGFHAGLNGPFVLATLPSGVRAGYVDTHLRGELAKDWGGLSRLELAWETVSGLALPVDQSRALMLRIADGHEPAAVAEEQP